MDSVIAGLGPAFAAGFAIQQALELFDQILNGALLGFDEENFYNKYKKLVLGVVATAIGLSIAFGLDLRMLHTLGFQDKAAWLDNILTGFFISAGTAGFNSLTKFLGYAKEQKASDAATSHVTASALAGATAVGAPAPAPGAELRRLQRR